MSSKLLPRLNVTDLVSSLTLTSSCAWHIHRVTRTTRKMYPAQKQPREPNPKVSLSAYRAGVCGLPCRTFSSFIIRQAMNMTP